MSLNLSRKGPVRTGIESDNEEEGAEGVESDQEEEGAEGIESDKEKQGAEGGRE